MSELDTRTAELVRDRMRAKVRVVLVEGVSSRTLEDLSRARDEHGLGDGHAGMLAEFAVAYELISDAAAIFGLGDEHRPVLAGLAVHAMAELHTEAERDEKTAALVRDRMRTTAAALDDELDAATVALVRQHMRVRAASMPARAYRVEGAAWAIAGEGGVEALRELVKDAAEHFGIADRHYPVLVGLAARTLAAADRGLPPLN